MIRLLPLYKKEGREYEGFPPLIFMIPLWAPLVLIMGFPTWFNTNEMTLHVWDTFHWGKLDEAIPPSHPNPILMYFQSLCPNFWSEGPKEIAREMDISKLVQAMFYVMAMAYAEELGVLFELVGDVLEDVLENP